MDPCSLSMVGLTAEVDGVEKSDCVKDYGVEQWAGRAEFPLVICYCRYGLAESYFDFVASD